MSTAAEYLTERLADARTDAAAAQSKITCVAYLTGYYALLADTTGNNDLGDLVRDLTAALDGTLDKDAIGGRCP